MAAKFVRLNRTAMRALKPGCWLIERGIEYQKLENGDGRFKINVMVDGVRIHRLIGLESEGVTRESAESAIEQLRTDARHRRLNLPKGRKLVVGFSAAADAYIQKLEEEGGKDMKMKRSHLTLHLKPFFKDTPLDQIEGTGKYKKHRVDQGATPASINRELAVLSHLYSNAVKWKWVTHRPFKIERMTEDEGRIVYLTEEQAARLVEAARASDTPLLWLFIEIGLGTSMRRMEILSIAVRHISIARQSIHIPKAKAGRREQPMTPRLTEILRAHLEGLPKGQEWLFPAPKSKSGHTVAIEKAYRRAVEAAGLDPKEVVRHTLRHTAITHLVQAGVDLSAVKRVSGHKTLAMVERYSHQNGEHIRAAMERYEQKIGLPELA